MEILVKGKKPGVFYGECPKCGAIVKATEDELRTGIGYEFVGDCPNCRHWIHFYHQNSADALVIVEKIPF